MRLVVDVSPLSHPPTGVGNYIRGSLRGIAEASGGADELVAFAPVSAGGKRNVEAALAGLTLERRLPVAPAAHVVRTLWSRLGTPPAERVVGPFDVLHFSDWMYPPQRAGLRSTMIHDLVPLRFPEWVHPRTRRMHGAKYRHAARTCDVVVVNSRFTGTDVAELLGIASDRIHVAYPGVDERFTSEGDRTELGGPFALAVATLEPRKNLSTLVEAYRRLGDTGLLLGVAGAPGWGTQPDLSFEGLVQLGYAHGDELARLYRGASVVVYPSLYEGFGMPVVEAMACGAPVVASSHPSLDEACGVAAIRADPRDPDSLAAAVREALERRDELVALGLEHVRAFTWKANGHAHLAAWNAA